MPTGKTKMGPRPPGCKEKKMERNQMQPTCSLKFVIECEVRDDPFGAYVKYNLEEIRKACLKRISAIQDIYSYHADWAEGVIEYLRKNHNDDWKKIIEWYIYAADYETDFGEDDPTLKRAIEFALSLSQDEEGLISKLLAGRLKKRYFAIEMYGKMPSVRVFFHRLVRNLYWEIQPWKRRGILRSGEYRDEVWYGAERALDVAVLASDFSLIEEIDYAVLFMEQKRIYASNSSHWSADRTRLAYLKEAKRQLKMSKRSAEKEKDELE